MFPTVLPAITDVLAAIAVILLPVPHILPAIAPVLESVGKATVVFHVPAILGTVAPIFPAVLNVFPAVAAIFPTVAHVLDFVASAARLRGRRCLLGSEWRGAEEGDGGEDGERVDSGSERLHGILRKDREVARWCRDGLFGCLVVLVRETLGSDRPLTAPERSCSSVTAVT